MAAVAVATGQARADAGTLEPACFVGRSAFGLVTLEDRQGRTFAALNRGQPLRVEADRVGRDGAQADVEPVGPYRVQGRVDRRHLWVFTRREVPIVDGWSWRRRDAVVRIEEGDGEHALVHYDGGCTSTGASNHSRACD